MSLLSDFIDRIPIEKGDTILFSSDVIRLGLYFHKNHEKLDLNEFLDLLVQKVGSEGTILLPTYNWGFCVGETFDYKNTPSKTGAIGQAALTHPSFKRTRHAFYSWAVAGKDRDYLCSLENTDAFGNNSPFNYLYEKKGKNVILDVSMQNCFTFVHFVEQSVGIPYRYIKNFTADYIDENSIKSTRTYSMYVRDYDLDAKCVLDPMEKQLIEKGIVTVTNVGLSRILEVPLDKAYDEIKDDILNNKAKKIAIYKGQYE